MESAPEKENMSDRMAKLEELEKVQPPRRTVADHLRYERVIQASGLLSPDVVAESLAYCEDLERQSPSRVEDIDYYSTAFKRIRKRRSPAKRV
ncbi:MAG: hypothetical protein QG573_1526 [Acidobacteriota bacterium]|nr:hypothetical protein [Acidobacteriota bacterium]